MEQVTLNISGKARRERLFGRDFLVAPVSMIVPGVLNGSQGPLLYQLEDITASYDFWNGMPLVANHPKDANGNSISARTPAILDKYGMGYVFNTQTAGKLGAEAWFDVEATKRVNYDVYTRVLNGEHVEVSTGLTVDREPKQGVWNDASGKTVDYVAIARNYRPDHLAVLPDSEGACSRKDGCGIHMNEKETDLGILQKAAELLKKLIPGNQPQTVTNEESTMEKLSPEKRKAIVDGLITNCSCTWKETDRETLNAMDEDTLAKCKAMMESHTKNQAKIREQEAALTANEQKLKNVEAGFQVGDQKFALNAEGKWEVAKEDKKVDNTQQPQAINEANLSPEIQADLAYARNMRKKEKDGLIRKLVANVAEDKKQEKINNLAKKSVEDLQEMLELMPVQNAPQEYAGNYQLSDLAQEEAFFSPMPGMRTGQFVGAGAGGFAGNTAAYKQEPLGLPEMTYESPIKALNNRHQD